MSVDLRKKEVQVKEEFGEVQHRRYNSTTIFCAITTSTDWQEFYTIIPIEISLYSAKTLIKDSMEGDEAELLVGDETQVGVNTASVAVDDDVIPVSDTVITNVHDGFWVLLDDGVNKDKLGRILEIGESTIKVEIAAQHAFATMKAIKIQPKMGHDLKFAGSGAVNFGDAMIGGSLIAAGTKIRIRYKNNKGTAKNLMLLLEYRY